MRAWLDAALAVLLAPTCAACHETLQHPTRGCVCADCWNGVVVAPEARRDCCGDHEHPRAVVLANGDCVHCADPSRHIARTRAIGPYTGALRNIIHALKYDARRSLARPLAQCMRRAGGDLVTEACVAVPVPLHPARRRERGFNQAADLACHLGLPVVHAIARVRATPSQTTLHAADRQANVHHAFRATRRARDLHGVTVLLVDDVRTTGATLEACAIALKEAGSGEVLALTAARVESSQR